MDSIGQESIKSPADTAYRPAGLAEGPDGALYITEDKHGRIWRVNPTTGRAIRLLRPPGMRVEARIVIFEPVRMSVIRTLDYASVAAESLTTRRYWKFRCESETKCLYYFPTETIFANRVRYRFRRCLVSLNHEHVWQSQR